MFFFFISKSVMYRLGFIKVISRSQTRKGLWEGEAVALRVMLMTRKAIRHVHRVAILCLAFNRTRDVRRT